MARSIITKMSLPIKGTNTGKSIRSVGSVTLNKASLFDRRSNGSKKKLFIPGHFYKVIETSPSGRRILRSEFADKATAEIVALKRSKRHPNLTVTVERDGLYN